VQESIHFGHSDSVDDGHEISNVVALRAVQAILRSVI